MTIFHGRLTSFKSFGFFASSAPRHCLVHLEDHTVPEHKITILVEVTATADSLKLYVFTFQVQVFARLFLELSHGTLNAVYLFSESFYETPNPQKRQIDMLTMQLCTWAELK